MTRSPKSNVRRLAIGRLISVTGGAAAYTALNYTVWERTHRVGGVVMIATGVLIAGSAFLAAPWSHRVMAAAIAAMAIILVAYSYFTWKKEVG